MKVFISSVIGGMEALREAAADGARTLRCSVLRAEDFGAAPTSPQLACLAAVRAADVVILILGGRYGDLQASGLSPTHEEYREARGQKRILAFVQQNAQQEERQLQLLAEARAWSGGVYTADFVDEATLRTAVIRGLHDLELTNATGPVDATEIEERAAAVLPDDRGRRDDRPQLHLAVAAGPRQSVLRPIELESKELERDLTRRALLDESAIFSTASATRASLAGRSLALEQEQAGLSLDEEGTVHLWLDAEGEERDDTGVFPVIIEERVQELLEGALAFACWTLDRIDPRQRLSHVVPTAAVWASSMVGWQARDDHARGQAVHRAGLSWTPARVVLSPPHRQRAALRMEAAELAQDLTRLLRREWRPGPRTR
jgi:hypothetical protein